MLALKKKLDQNLIDALESNEFKNYRVIIHSKSMPQKLYQKLASFKVDTIRCISSINCVSVSIQKKLIERLVEYPEIDYIGFDSQALLCASSISSANGIYYDTPYKLSGKGITVGVIDSGIYPHKDLTLPRNKIAYFKDIVNDITYPYDDNGHGTFISGIISSSGYCSKGMYKGIAENASIYMIKAFNGIGRAFVSDLLYSIENILSESEKFNIRVLCLPFELIEYNKFILSLFNQLLNELVAKNIIPVVPSGHNGNTENSMTGIATLSNCITIGGLDTTHSPRAYIYSSSGSNKNQEKPDLSASCVDIYSLNSDLSYKSERNGMKLYPSPLNQPYITYTGSSIAAAFISGICAILLENNKDLTFQDILSSLKLSCTLLNIPKSIQGAGFIDFKSLLP
jgi:hypothetical protein